MGVDFKKTPLVPAVVQDEATGQVLMLGYVNHEALRLTLATHTAWFYSRSRQKLWQKGETSGNILRVRRVFLDCDADTLLYMVNPAGPACHTGQTSCFFTEIPLEEKPDTHQ